MIERNVSLHSAIAYLLWPSGFILVAIGLFTRFELGQLGIVVCMVAATLTVRGYFCGLEQRERTAYNLGRESVRSLR